MKMRLFVLCPLFLLAFSPAAARGGAADIGQVQTVRTKEDIAILPNGDLGYAAEMKFNVNEYNRIKSQNVNPYRLVRDVRSAGGSVWRDIKVTAEDADHSYRIGAVIAGVMKNMGDHWEGEMTKGYDYVSLAGNEMAFTYAADSGEGYKFQGKAYIKFPAGATDIRWDGDRHLVSYRLLYRQQAGGRTKAFRAFALICGAVFVVSALRLLRG